MPVYTLAHIACLSFESGMVHLALKGHRINYACLKYEFCMCAILILYACDDDKWHVLYAYDDDKWHVLYACDDDKWHVLYACDDE